MKALRFLSAGIVVAIIGLMPLTARAAPVAVGGIDVHTHSLTRRCSALMFSHRDIGSCVEGPVAANALLIKRRYPYTVQRVTTPADGHARISLAAGDYIVRPFPTAAVYPVSRTKYVRVAEGSFTPVHLYYRPITIGAPWWE